MVVREQNLPTWPDLVHRALMELDQARSSMSAARDWLNSDWWPPGTSLADAAADARTRVFTMIGTIKGQIDEIKNLLRDSETDT
jgi:hypothetical protein